MQNLQIYIWQLFIGPDIIGIAICSEFTYGGVICAVTSIIINKNLIIFTNVPNVALYIGYIRNCDGCHTQSALDN